MTLAELYNELGEILPRRGEPWASLAEVVVETNDARLRDFALEEDGTAIVIDCHTAF